MEEGHVERIRRGQEEFSRGDLDELLSFVSDDVDWGTTGQFPGLERSYRGPDALVRWMETVRSAWESFEVSVQDVIHEADDVVVLSERLWGRGRESGAEVEMRIFAVYWFEAEKVTRRRVFDNRADALEAAGLED
jgi:ketosteroid isomerase-like protein